MTLWIKELLKNLDCHVDEPTRIKIMEACGERCPFTHLPDDRLLAVKESCPDDVAFMDALCDEWRLRHENGNYYVVFDQCYCPLVNQDLEGVSPTLCFCTLGCYSPV